MKKALNNYLVIISALLLSVTILTPGFSQKKDRVRMKLSYTKDLEGERSITIGLTAGSGKSMHGVKNGEVTMSAAQGDSTIVLATLQTDTTGIVKLYLEKEYVLPMSEDGISTIYGSYEGDENYNSASNEIQVMELLLDLTFEERDSVRYLIVTANQPNGDATLIPIEGLDVKIGVQRLLSVLPLEKVTTDADGWAEIECPTNLPGDEAGNLTFVVQVEDHDLYGTVFGSASKDWGIPVSHEVKPLPRQLFTDEAPFWMIASVFIILLGAWYHFFLSISKLFKIKKAA